MMIKAMVCHKLTSSSTCIMSFFLNTSSRSWYAVAFATLSSLIVTTPASVVLPVFCVCTCAINEMKYSDKSTEHEYFVHNIQWITSWPSVQVNKVSPQCSSQLAALAETLPPTDKVSSFLLKSFPFKIWNETAHCRRTMLLYNQTFGICWTGSDGIPADILLYTIRRANIVKPPNMSSCFHQKSFGSLLYIFIHSWQFNFSIQRIHWWGRSNVLVVEQTSYWTSILVCDSICMYRSDQENEFGITFISHQHQHHRHH